MLAAYGSNLLPVDYKSEGANSPLLRYSYERTRQALHGLAREEGPHPAHGIKLRYANPANGKHPFPTMAVFMHFLRRGTAFNVVEGTGTVEIAGERTRFSMHDIFVVPPWTP